MVYTIGFNVKSSAVGLNFFIFYCLKDSSLSITTMPTIFERWKSGKLLVWKGLVG
jgi:hypothetical protein